jgi:xanthine/uracil/vitamin C permease (AzgA family)
VFGGGLAIGIVMAVLTLTRAIEWLARAIPEEAVRGIQFGLGLKLATIALRDYVAGEGSGGILLGGVCITIVLLLRQSRRIPAALVIITLGVAYALSFRLNPAVFAGSFGLAFPSLHIPTPSDIWQGLLVLGLAQIPLSLGNSIFATQRLAADYFPDKRVGVSKIGLSYSLMNFVAPFFSGMPVCHGSGGMAGHYGFGARTGGSVLIYGLFFLALGLFFSGGFTEIIQVFPLPVLGAILLFEAVYLLLTVRHVAGDNYALFTTLLVGLLANGLPYGFLVALIVGWLMGAARRQLQLQQ